MLTTWSMSTNQYTFFGDHLALELLKQRGDRLVALDEKIDWKPLVEAADKIWKAARTKPGRGNAAKPWPSYIMLKAILLGRMYNLGDDDLEYQIRDRLSFMRFVGLGLGEDVPDARTIWVYRDKLGEAGVRALFDGFVASLKAKGYILHEGKVLDATIVETPRQRNSREDNEIVKSGQVPPEWKKNPDKLIHKDCDARWTKKGDEQFYGYKNHVKIGESSKLICDYRATPANVADVTMAHELVGPADAGKIVWADAGYAGAPFANRLAELGIEGRVHEKGQAGAPLNDKQKANNREKSVHRARVEHPFAFMEMSLGGIYQRCIGLTRNARDIGLTNLIYNIFRLEQLSRGDDTPGAASTATA